MHYGEDEMRSLNPGGDQEEFKDDRPLRNERSFREELTDRSAIN